MWCVTGDCVYMLDTVIVSHIVSIYKQTCGLDFHSMLVCEHVHHLTTLLIGDGDDDDEDDDDLRTILPVSLFLTCGHEH